MTLVTINLLAEAKLFNGFRKRMSYCVRQCASGGALGYWYIDCVRHCNRKRGRRALINDDEDQSSLVDEDGGGMNNE